MLVNITPNAYFQPPSNLSMKYPAIVYSRKSIDYDYANDSVYKNKHAYDITIVDKNPDSKIAVEVSKLRYCKFDRQFTTDGLNHIVFKLYY